MLKLTLAALALFAASAPVTAEFMAGAGFSHLAYFEDRGMISTNLTPTTVWSPVTNAVQSTGAVFSAATPASADRNRFYRLQSK